MTKVYDLPNDKQDNSSKRATIRIGIFFDGTANNKDNVRLRESYDNPEERKKMTAEDIAVYKKEKDNESYKNAVTNVVKLYDTYLFTQESSYIKRIYIEGIGTVTKKEDQVMMGLGLGYRYSGVRGKVFRGCYEVSTLPILKGYEFKKSEVTIVFDIFGFSRGAATARNFAYELIRKDSVAEDIDIQVINDEVHAEDGMKKSIDDVEYKTDNMLPQYGMLGYCLDKYSQLELANVKIKIRYMGLFDTVASYNNGFQLHPNFTKDLSKLHLNDIMDDSSPIKPLKTVHLTSEDEHRVNFALSVLPKKDKTNIEISFPGVHSDIGGGYVPKYNENKLLIEESLHMAKGGVVKSFNIINSYRNYLISQYWFKDNEICLGNCRDYYPPMYINRKNLSDKYADIPLHYMYELCDGDTLFDKKLFNNKSEIKECTTMETAIRESIGASYDKMIPLQIAYTNKVNKEKEEREKKMAQSMFNTSPIHLAYLDGVPPFSSFISNELLSYHENRISRQYPSDVEIISYFYNRLSKRFNGGNYEFNTLPTDLFIKKYAPEAEKSESAFYFTKNKETIITAIIDQIYYGILRNRYIHWSSNDIESTYNTMNITPHEPVRNNDVENFNRKRYIYNQ